MVRHRQKRYSYLVFVLAALIGYLVFIPKEDIQYREIGFMKTSWYGKMFHGKITADGEVFDYTKLTAAHKSLPFNTKLRLTNKSNGKHVIVRINDRGPYVGDRELDVSKEAAIRLGILDLGVHLLFVEEITSDEER